MELKEFLKENPLISRSNLALKMFPHVPKTAKTRFTNKFNEAKAGSGNQRFTDDDIKIGWKVLKDLAEDIMQKAPTKE